MRHHPVERWVKPEEFVELAAEAEEIGFAGVHDAAARAFVVPRRSAVQQAMEARANGATARVADAPVYT